MHIVHSAVRNANTTSITARQQGYLAACKKHRDTIAAIQQYLPGWAPPFEACNEHLTTRTLQLKVNS